MSDVEKSTQATAVPAGDSHTRDHPVLDLSSWKYKSIKLGPVTIPPYASPETQLLLVSLVCFLCPGMFNALSGLGAGGGTDPRAADDANIALYSTFAVIGFFAGTFANKLGIKISLSFGGLATASTASPSSSISILTTMALMSSLASCSAAALAFYGALRALL